MGINHWQIEEMDKPFVYADHSNPGNSYLKEVHLIFTICLACFMERGMINIGHSSVP